MPPDMTSISWWVTQLGPSGIFLFITWRVLQWIKPHFESLVPLIKDLIVGHCRLMSVMEENLKSGSETLKKVSSTQDGHGEMLKDIHQKIVK